MSAAYRGQKRSQRRRREALERIRTRLGDRRFADFIVDHVSENGPTTQVGNLPALAELWVQQQGLEMDAAKDLLGASKRVGERTVPAQVPHVPAWLGAVLRAERLPLRVIDLRGRTKRAS